MSRTLQLMAGFCSEGPWTKGKTSAKAVKEMASLAQEQGMPNIEKLASMEGETGSSSRIQKVLLNHFKNVLT